MKIVGLLSFLIFAPFLLMAQGQSIEIILEEYEEEQGIKFAYDQGFFDLIELNFEYEEDINLFFTEVQNNLPLTVNNLGDNYYSFSPVVQDYKISLIDSIDQKSISPADIFVFKNGKTIPSIFNTTAVLFEYKPSPYDTLILYAIGYEKIEVPLAQLINNHQITQSISPITVQLTGFTIEDYLTTGIDLGSGMQNVNIETKDLALLPGETDGDIFASLAALPGITSPDSRAGNLYIRGSSTDQSLILFDNIPIYHRGHYYGTISPYNPKVIDEVEVYRSGFHPRLGGRVGGAIVIKSDQTNASQFGGGVGANLLYYTAYGKTPIGKKIGISVGARRSLPPGFQSTKLTAISESVFSGTGIVDSTGSIDADIETIFEDYNAKIIYQINKRNRFAASVIYTNNDVTYLGVGLDSVKMSQDENRFQNLGVNLNFKSQLSESFKNEFSATISNYTFDYRSKPSTSAPRDNYISTNELTDFNLKEEVSIALGKNNLEIGLDYKWQEVIIDHHNVVMADEPYFFNQTTNSHSVSPYVNLDLISMNQWQINAGVRGTYYSLLNTVKLDPRLFVTYDANDWLIFKGSAGLYHQFLSQLKYLEFSAGGFDNELWTLADEKMGNIITGQQYTLGTIIHDRGWVLDIEGYSKTMDNISIYETRRLSDESVTHTGDQWIRGVDVLLKKRLNKNLDMWASYSYSQSEISIDTAQDISYPAKYVQPHVLYIGAAYEWRQLKVSASWKYASGLWAKSLDMVDAENIFLKNFEPPTDRPPPPMGGNGPPPIMTPFDNLPERYDAYHTLDISASYKLPKTESRKWSASLGVSLINVFDNEILVDQVYKGNPPDFISRYAIGFAPNVMLMIEW
ncbi:MAG: TonB-dependent receptor plug domain-containing protein [Reichenbachiella sp.]